MPTRWAAQQHREAPQTRSRVRPANCSHYCTQCTARVTLPLYSTTCHTTAGHTTSATVAVAACASAHSLVKAPRGKLQSRLMLPAACEVPIWHRRAHQCAQATLQLSQRSARSTRAAACQHILRTAHHSTAASSVNNVLTHPRHVERASACSGNKPSSRHGCLAVRDPCVWLQHPGPGSFSCKATRAASSRVSHQTAHTGHHS